MNRTERLLWQRVKGLYPGVAARVENGACPGYPDTHGVFLGRDYWVELKVVRTKVPILSNECLLRLLQESQVVWALKRIRYAGYGRLFLLVGFKDYLVLRRVTIVNGLWVFEPVAASPDPATVFDKLGEVLCR